MNGAGARAWRLAGALCGLVVALDQATKALIEAKLIPGEVIDFVGPVELTLSYNSGVAFGFAGGSSSARIALLGVLGLAVIGYVFARTSTHPGMWVAAGLLAGGALGNLADRVRADAVTDFVLIGSWPAFNLADVAVTIGVLVMVLSFLRDPSP